MLSRERARCTEPRPKPMELLIELVKLATAIVVLVTALKKCHSEIGDGDKEKEEGR